MTATNPPPGPRLVRPDDGPTAAADAPRRTARRPWLLALALAAALVAFAGWGITARRASGLEARVAELSGALDAARAEITARQRHLEALRGVAAEVEARVAELRTLAEQTPTAPVVAPAPAGAPAGAD